jgi:hypothetical protein
MDGRCRDTTNIADRPLASLLTRSSDAEAERAAVDTVGQNVSGKRLACAVAVA